MQALYPLMIFSKETSPGYLINHLGRLFARGLQARIKPLGLSTGVFPVMLQLWDRDGLAQKDLIERVGVEQATMANTLSRMERDALIVRTTDTRDARMQRVWLTDKGRALHAPATAEAMKENDAALAGFSSHERSQLVHLLSKAISDIERRHRG